MGRIVIPRPRLRPRGPAGQVQLRRPRPKPQPRRPLTLKEKYGVSEYELIRLGLDAAIGLGGRAAASSETARRRRQRAAQAEGATDVPASAEAFLAQMDPPALSARLDEPELLQRRGTQPIAMSGAAPEDRDRWEGARQDVMQEAGSSSWSPTGTQTGGWAIDPLGEMAGRRSERVIGLEEAGALQTPPIMDTRMPTPQLQVGPSLQPMPPAQTLTALQTPLMVRPPPTPQQRRASYIPTTLGEAQAMARFATTQEEMAIAMEHIDQLARAGSLEDAITGAHIRRAQEAALRGWRPPRGETALDRAKLENITQRTETSRAQEESIRKRMEVVQGKLDKDTAKSAKVSKGLRRTGDDSGAAAQDELRGWSKDYTDKVSRTGDYADGSPELVALGGGTPYITWDAAGDLLWKKRSGRFANEDNKTISGAVYRTWPDGTGSRRTNKRNKGLRGSADAMTSSAINLAKKRAEADISVETLEAKEGIKNRARQDILGFKATLPTTGERTGAASRKGRINEKLADVRAALTAATRPDAKVYYEEYIRNLEGLLTQSAGPAGIPTYVPGTVSKPTQLESSGR